MRGAAALLAMVGCTLVGDGVAWQLRLRRPPFNSFTTSPTLSIPTLPRMVNQLTRSEQCEIEELSKEPSRINKGHSAGRPNSDRDIFCNTELNMQNIKAVGFDMDYTLAQYLPSFDLLAYDGTKEKLMRSLRYPTIVQELQYQANLCQRGCVIDLKRGNILKLDKHRYLRVAEHGLTPLDSNIQFYNVDSPFSMVDACLFAQLVDLRDRASAQLVGSPTDQAFFAGKSYAQLWRDMSACLSRCHRDGVIKRTVASAPENFIVHDPRVFDMLASFRSAGKKTFLVTNSLWDYTHVVMSYLHNPAEPASMRWTDFFDVIIVGANKPAFLLDESGSLSLYQVLDSDGGLKNVQWPHERVREVRALPRRIFQGGNAQLLHALLEVASGDEILYVGDHIYSDIVRSKNSLGWRTCLIVPELTHELTMHQQHHRLRDEAMQLRKLQHHAESELDRIHVSMTGRPSNEEGPTEDRPLRAKYRAIEQQLEALQSTAKRKLQNYDDMFHPKWGRLFKAGFQDSRIFKQIRDFACIYTSRASNLAAATPGRSFRPTPDVAAHDIVLALQLETSYNGSISSASHNK